MFSTTNNAKDYLQLCKLTGLRISLLWISLHGMLITKQQKSKFFINVFHIWCYQLFTNHLLFRYKNVLLVICVQSHNIQIARMHTNYFKPHLDGETKETLNRVRSTWLEFHTFKTLFAWVLQTYSWLLSKTMRPETRSPLVFKPNDYHTYTFCSTWHTYYA